MNGTITKFEASGWEADGKLFNNHVTAIGDGFTLRFLFTIQWLKRWFKTQPSLALTFFQRPWTTDASGKRLGVRFQNIGPPVEGLFDIHDRGANKPASLICNDAGTIEEVLSRFVIPAEVAVTVFGKGLEIARIPLAHDPHFVLKFETFKASQ